jgi:ABC-2 type transport system ATP-binding protein
MVDAEGLVVTFRTLFRSRFRALDGLSLHVEEGDCFALLGQNGAGKSTAMYCLLGLIRPDAGEVRVLGRRPEPGSAIFRDIGYLPEEPHYHAYLTVEEAVTYYSSLSGAPPSAARVSEMLERLRLIEHRDRRIAACSKGMKQKVGVAQCLLHAPKLLFLDEPMRGLDPVTVHEFRQMLGELHRAGTTIVINSHLLGEVEQLATRVAIVDRGRLVVQDTVERLMRTDRETYDIEVEHTGELPPFVVTEPRVNGVARGVVPSDRLHDFFDFTRAHEIRIVSCALRRSSLEDAFLRVVGEANARATAAGSAAAAPPEEPRA